MLTGIKSAGGSALSVPARRHRKSALAIMATLRRLWTAARATALHGQPQPVPEVKRAVGRDSATATNIFVFVPTPSAQLLYGPRKSESSCQCVGVKAPPTSIPKTTKQQSQRSHRNTMRGMAA